MDNVRTLIVMPVKNNIRFIKESVYSILKYTKPDFRFLIINDNSKEDAVVEYLKELSNESQIEIMHNNESLGYGFCANEGIQRLRGEKIFILSNSDVFVTPKWLEEVIRAFEVSPQTGIIGPSTSWGAFQQSFMHAQENRLKWKEEDILNFAIKVKDLYRNKLYNWNHANGFFWIAQSKIFQTLGFFDEQFSPGFSEETDMNMRARKAGIGIGHLRGLYIHHRGNQAYAVEELINQNYNVNFTRQICDQRFKQRWNNPQAAPIRIERYSIEQIKEFIKQNTQNKWIF